MNIKLVLFVALFGAMCGSAFAQNGVRFDSQVTQTAPVATTTFVVVPTNPIVRFCNAPANGVPCSNLATTYTDATLGTPCSTSTQIVLAGTTTCVASPDAENNWGVWVAAGQYAYTVTVKGANFGPYYVTAGASGGSSEVEGSPSDPETCTPATGTASQPIYYNTTSGRLRYCVATNTWADFAYTGNGGNASKPILAIDSFLRPDAASGTYTGNWVGNGTDTAIQVLSDSAQTSGAPSLSAGTASSGLYSENTGAEAQVPGGLPSTGGWPNNQGAQFVIKASSGASDVVGVWCRGSTSAKTGYLFFVFGGAGVAGGGTARIYKYTAGSFVQQGSDVTGFTYNVGDSIGCEATGQSTTTVKGFQNGDLGTATPLITITDSSTPILSGSPGIFLNNITGQAAGSNFIGYATDASVFSGPQVVFIGDSIISRWNLRTQFTSSTFANAGIGGQTSTQILARFSAEVLPIRPAAVVIEGGRNGLQLGTETVAQTLANMQTMGALARANGIQVIYTDTIQSCNMSDPGGLKANIDLLNADMPSIMLTGDLISNWNGAVDTQPPPTDCISGNYIADLIHPNTTGYALIAPLIPSITAIDGNLLGLNGLYAPIVGGTIPGTYIPAPTSSSLGGVATISCPAGQFLSAIPVTCGAGISTPGWSVQDSFQQSSSTLSTNWTVLAGAVSVSSQTAVGGNNGANNFAAWTATTVTSDQVSQVRVNAVSSADYVGVFVRGSGAGASLNAYYFVEGGTGDANCYLDKFVAGTKTQLKTTGCTMPAMGDTLKVIVVGTSLTCYRNGSHVSALDATDSSLTSGSPGMFPGNTGSSALDNWSGGNSTAAAKP